MASQRPVYQDGREFYDLETGAVVARYPDLVKHDHDTDGAQAARRKFLSEHPGYRMCRAGEGDTLLADDQHVPADDQHVLADDERDACDSPRGHNWSTNGDGGLYCSICGTGDL